VAKSMAPSETKTASVVSQTRPTPTTLPIVSPATPLDWLLVGFPPPLLLLGALEFAAGVVVVGGL
ncbi:hypothetical protein NDU88_000486, partial [Pleurodeles waltl]